MRPERLLIAVAGQHLIPALLASAVLGAALALLFGPGRVRRPADRVLFLQVALAKVVLALWVGEKVPYLLSHHPARAYYGFTLPSLVPDRIAFEPSRLAVVPANSPLAGRVFIVLLAVGAALLCYRWLRLAPLYRRVYESRRVGADDVPEAFEQFAALVSKIRRHVGLLPRPSLMVIRRAPCPAFTMGLLRPVVVVAAELVEQLGPRELRGILAHELAHVGRFDYLGRWFAAILRDLLVWNPLAWIWYEQLVAEQERACDELGARLLGDGGAVASGLVETAAFANRLPVVSIGPLAAWRQGRDSRQLVARLDALEAVSSDPWPTRSPRAFLCYPLLALFMLAQPHIALPMP